MRGRWCLTSIIAGALLVGCPAKKETVEPRPAAREASEHGHGETKEHGHGEGSDLDRPVETLFAQGCEHGKKAFECDTCRYEVGVVKVSPAVLEGGLVQTAKVERRRVGLPLSLTGEVQFDDRRVAHVSSQAEGIIRKAHVALGDRVRRGQPLVELESIAIGEAQATHLEAQGLLKLARRNFERLTALGKEGITSQKEHLLARQELEAAEIRAEGALGRLTRLGVAPGQARALSPGGAKGRLVLRAPAEGTVLEMHAVPGEIAKSEESLLTVGDNAVVWVWADVYERDVAPVARAQAKQPLPAAVSVPAYPGEEFQGTVDFVSPSMSKVSRTVKLRIAVPNAEARLLAGMFASVKVFLPGNEDALVVPRSAVVEDEGRSFVFVHHHADYYLRRPVAVGRAFAGLLELRKSLPLGTTVVADGAFLLKSDVLRSKMGAGCAD